MGDYFVVEGLVTDLLCDCRNALRTVSEPRQRRDVILKLATKWTDTLSAENPGFRQTMTPQRQMAWLQVHELGVGETVPKRAVQCFVLATLNRFARAIVDFDEGQINEDQYEFWLATAVEDTLALLLGAENRAD